MALKALPLALLWLAATSILGVSSQYYYEVDYADKGCKNAVFTQDAYNDPFLSDADTKTCRLPLPYEYYGYQIVNWLNAVFNASKDWRSFFQAYKYVQVDKDVQGSAPNLTVRQYYYAWYWDTDCQDMMTKGQVATRLNKNPGGWIPQGCVNTSTIFGPGAPPPRIGVAAYRISESDFGLPGQQPLDELLNITLPFLLPGASRNLLPSMVAIALAMCISLVALAV